MVWRQNNQKWTMQSGEKTVSKMVSIWILCLLVSELLITFANSLDPDQAQQNVGPDLGPYCLTHCRLHYRNIFFISCIIFLTISKWQKCMQNFPACKKFRQILQKDNISYCVLCFFTSIYLHLGLVATKPVLGVSDQVVPNPACSATETS